MRQIVRFRRELQTPGLRMGGAPPYGIDVLRSGYRPRPDVAPLVSLEANSILACAERER